MEKRIFPSFSLVLVLVFLFTFLSHTLQGDSILWLPPNFRALEPQALLGPQPYLRLSTNVEHRTEEPGGKQQRREAPFLSCSLSLPAFSNFLLTLQQVISEKRTNSGLTNIKRHKKPNTKTLIFLHLFASLFWLSLLLFLLLFPLLSTYKNVFIRSPLLPDKRHYMRLNRERAKQQHWTQTKAEASIHTN